MKFPTPQVDYRSFRLSKINTPEFCHLWYLLFWVLYILRYILVENLNPAAVYQPIWCPLDDLIPFCEWFVIPYVLWYALIALMHLYTMLYDVKSFQRYSRFLIVSVTISTLTFLLFPSCQNLRPTEFPRDNALARLVGLLYALDTNTNVLPSEHVMLAIAVFLAALNTKSLRRPIPLTLIGILTLSICLATVFIKQHSVLDALAALPVCAFSYWVTYRRKI